MIPEYSNLRQIGFKMNQSKCLVDGDYQLALPWRLGAPNFNNNHSLAQDYTVCKKDLKKRGNEKQI